MTKPDINFQALIDTIHDQKDRKIAMAMFVLVSSALVGADAERIARKTGLPLEFIHSIAGNLVDAGLWIGTTVDDSGWWDKNGDPDYFALFIHARVALGSVLRKTTPNYIMYIDRETKEVIWRLKRTSR